MIANAVQSSLVAIANAEKGMKGSKEVFDHLSSDFGRYIRRRIVSSHDVDVSHHVSTRLISNTLATSEP